MSVSSHSDGAAPARRFDAVAALKDTGLTTLIAFGLFLPLVGFLTTTDVRNDLILQTRFPLLFSLTASIGVARLVYLMSIARWLAFRAERPVAAARPAQLDWGTIAAKWFIPFA